MKSFEKPISFAVRSVCAIFGAMFLISVAEATEIKVFSSYLTDASYEWQSKDEKASIPNFLNENNVDFGYFCGPKAVNYFPITTDENYSVDNKQIVQAYGGIHVFAWRTEKYDMVKRYDPVLVGSNGKMDACVFTSKENGAQFAIVAPTDNPIKKFDALNSFVEGIKTDYPGVMVFVGTTWAWAKPHPDVANYLTDTMGYVGSEVEDTCGGVFAPFESGLTIDQTSVKIGTLAKEPAALAVVKFPNKYLAKFMSYDGTVISSSRVVEHSSVNPPDPPVRTGYEFIGWMVDSVVVDESFFEDVTADFEAIAQYKEVGTDRLVTFLDWNGTTLSEVKVVKGEKVSPPADPVRQYYSFAGWVCDGVPYDFDTPVVENLVLTATYKLAITSVDIESAEDFVAALSADYPLEVVFRLVADLDFTDVTYTPVDFFRTLDGNGHSITGLPVNSGGLFATLYGTVHDLTLANISSSQNLEGDCAILAKIANGAIVYNCTISNANCAHGRINGQYGGFFVRTDANAAGQGTVVSNCVIRNSKFLISLDRDSQFVGGFVAQASNTSFVDCRFESDDSASTSVGGQSAIAGGIVGKTGSNVMLRRCFASGRIEASHYTSYEYCGVAGIVGSVSGHTFIESCTNEANIVAISGNGAAGIVGRGYGNGTKLTIRDVSNSGNVVVQGAYSANKGSGAGGIVGGAYVGMVVSVSDAVNHGAVESTDRAGGIVGCADAGGNTSIKLTVSNSFNYASVAAEEVAGGVVGRLFGSYVSALRNVGNAGDVSCATNATGGLVGLVNVYGNTDGLPIDGGLQVGKVSTVSGVASLGIGVLEKSAWSASKYDFKSVILAGSAVASGDGKVSSLCGGYIAIGEDKDRVFSFVVDDNCRIAGEYDVAYYDKDGQPQTLEITPMTAAQLTTRKGAVKWLNDNADEKGFMRWVRGRNCPELAAFGEEYVSGLMLHVR